MITTGLLEVLSGVQRPVPYQSTTYPSYEFSMNRSTDERTISDINTKGLNLSFLLDECIGNVISTNQSVDLFIMIIYIFNFKKGL